MATARKALDELIVAFPELGHQIKSNSGIVHSPHFDNGIVKLQLGREFDLSDLEKNAVSIYALDPTYELSDTSERNEEKHDQIAARLQREVERERCAAMRKSNYLPTYHVLSTSVICESLF